MNSADLISQDNLSATVSLFPLLSAIKKPQWLTEVFCYQAVIFSHEHLDSCYDRCRHFVQLLV